MAVSLKAQMGARVRAARERLGLNQADVAERVGISNAVYGRIERGLSSPRLVTLMRLCDVLQVQPNDLLTSALGTVRNDGMRAELRQLLAVLEDSDTETIKRVVTIARWVRPPRGPNARGTSRAKK